MNIVIGIVSWLPEIEPDRSLRIDRLNRLFLQLETLFPKLPILAISQNWKDYKPKIPVIEKRFDCGLGILKARQTLIEEFRKTTFDYLIMTDDDAIIKCENNANIQYLKLINEHPNGFCFLQYEASQLNICALSKHILEKEDMVDVNAQAKEAYEDVVFAHLLHYKYPELEFLPPKGLSCIHFCNTNEKAPSTWANGKIPYGEMSKRSYQLVDYISKNHEVPHLRYFFAHNVLLSKNATQIDLEKELQRLAKSKEKADGRAGCYLYF